MIIVIVVCTAWYLLLKFDYDVLYQLVFYFCVYAWSRHVMMCMLYYRKLMMHFIDAIFKKNQVNIKAILLSCK